MPRSELIGIMRKCKSCNVWKSIELFRGRVHVCGACAVLHTRSYVLTDKGREDIAEAESNAA